MLYVRDENGGKDHNKAAAERCCRRWRAHHVFMSKNVATELRNLAAVTMLKEILIESPAHI